ncbi:uncharacterized protein MELLADRAFT_109843 [Melampsora larici-populina 98AG31]|uniref:Uncharacterized protein n=1 Tax=Melampsora larici-populina (strain 98AG31 / pathotype 3-4-7) TaxID=747676 RepID=F4RXT5_MELLP|nr:uncharacterized protein MELLADRAFT_109843 [Melampsora larici-populina 98AG31]EGG02785.1 hypothetical protein MELLADRAFT_109843 [Melampsora larici-populina 98AG31]
MKPLHNLLDDKNICSSNPGSEAARHMYNKHKNLIEIFTKLRGSGGEMGYWYTIDFNTCFASHSIMQVDFNTPLSSSNAESLSEIAPPFNFDYPGSSSPNVGASDNALISHTLPFSPHIMNQLPYPYAQNLGTRSLSIGVEYQRRGPIHVHYVVDIPGCATNPLNAKLKSRL